MEFLGGKRSFDLSDDGNDDIDDSHMKRAVEFLGGKRSSEDAEDKRAVEFLGGKRSSDKRAVEFLGGRKRAIEFLGGRKRAIEFLGGKRATPYEPSKRAIEFLGGKRSSDFSGREANMEAAIEAYLHPDNEAARRTLWLLNAWHNYTPRDQYDSRF